MKKLLLFSLFAPSLLLAQWKAVPYKDGNQSLNGLAVTPEIPTAQKAGILILPAWMGIDEHEKEVALQLANLGFHTFVADIYGEGNYPKNTAEAGSQAGYYKKNIADYQRRIQLALNELIRQGANKDKLVVVGYCFGGTGALEAARAGLQVQGVVSFHGGLGKAAERGTTEINSKVLVLHGADDPFVSEQEIAAFQKEMKTAKADWQMIYYSGAVHSFTNKKAGNDMVRGAAYNELADKRSFDHFVTFLKSIL